MLRISGQKCPAFWRVWTRRRKCSPAPRELSYRTEQALWMEEWKDRQNSGPDWHPWAAEPTTPGTSASGWFASLCQGLMKAVEAGVLFIIKVPMSKHGVTRQGCMLGMPSLLGGSPPPGGPVARISASSFDPLQTLELLNDFFLPGWVGVVHSWLSKYS